MLLTARAISSPYLGISFLSLEQGLIMAMSYRVASFRLEALPAPGSWPPLPLPFFVRPNVLTKLQGTLFCILVVLQKSGQSECDRGW